MNKKILSLTFSLLLSISAFAQQMNVTQTKHNKAITKDQVSKGTFTFTRPSNVNLSFNGGKDAWLINSGVFTMVQGGKSRVASSQVSSQFKSLEAVFQHIFNKEGATVSLSDCKDLKVSTLGNETVYTITPVVSDAKQRRRLMFSSLVVTTDAKTGKLKSMRMNEKDTNYTQYDFER